MYTHIYKYVNGMGRMQTKLIIVNLSGKGEHMNRTVEIMVKRKSEPYTLLNKFQILFYNIVVSKY